MPSNATANAAYLDHAYNAIVADWRARNLSTLRNYDAALEEYRITFAYNSGVIENAAGPAITAQCLRVPCSNGHMAAVFASFAKKPTREEILDCLMEILPEKGSASCPPTMI